MLLKKYVVFLFFVFSTNAFANLYIDSEIGVNYSSNSLPSQYSKFEEDKTLSLAWSGSIGYSNSYLQLGLGNASNLFSDIKKSHVFLDTALWFTPSFALRVKPILKSWYDDDALVSFSKAKFKDGFILGASYVFSPWMGVSVNYETVTYRIDNVQINQDTDLDHKGLFLSVYFPWTL